MLRRTVLAQGIVITRDLTNKYHAQLELGGLRKYGDDIYRATAKSTSFYLCAIKESFIPGLRSKFGVGNELDTILQWT